MMVLAAMGTFFGGAELVPAQMSISILSSCSIDGQHQRI
jgi:hypothetical protein